MKNIVAILFIIFGFVKAWSANGDIFTVTTIEGIEMNFKVINESAKTCEVTQPAIPLETEGIVTIPETANGYQVVRIGQNAFENCSNITSVSFPDCLNTIDYDAFSYSLETMFVKWETPISISQDVINGENTTLFVPIGCRAAYETAETWSMFNSIIDDVFMANTVEDVPMFFKIINEEEKRCEVNGNIIRAIPTDYEGEITIPSEIDGYDVVGIGNSAFSECKGITRVSLPDRTEYIGDGAFSKCI